MKKLANLNQSPLCQKARSAALALLMLAVPLFLGAWTISTGRGINTNYIDRIQDGKTKKHEILTLFGDPQETKRSPEGITFVYKSLRAKTEKVRRQDKDADSKVSAAVDSPYSLEETLKRSKPKEGPAQEVSSTLTIFFGKDGETVQSHEYKEY
jgi:outer membrane protein assembly factor BamE (lipoprotein component of BamABCDE complex)